MVNSYHDPTISPQQYANMVRAYSDHEIRNAPADVLRSIAEGRRLMKAEEARVSGSTRKVIDDDRRTETEETTTPSTSEPRRNNDQRTQIIVEASTFSWRRRPFPRKIQQHVTTTCPNDDERRRRSREPRGCLRDVASSRVSVDPDGTSCSTSARRSSLNVFDYEMRRRARFHWLASSERAQRRVTQTYG
ncbi:uncharacterized protein LOC106651736 [Trichogramma pretiosum]|uniref:uncharacterized protein LOC106651736 n=1 Tax=Trichogramma pretiosum TaxID=7493 RepID=UPI0006C952E1|nr:uncharacterized protein LOC106651736 [Trichogramma pretiosum]